MNKCLNYRLGVEQKITETDGYLFMDIYPNVTRNHEEGNSLTFWETHLIALMLRVMLRRLTPL